LKFFSDAKYSKKGVIEISTLNINRAIFHLGLQGLHPVNETNCRRKRKNDFLILDKTHRVLM